MMNYEEWRQWWTDFAPTYFTDKVWCFSRPDLIQRLNIVKESKVLEIGFGYGRELFNFCKLSNNVHGIELTEWACQHVQEELTSRGVQSVPMLFPYDGETIPFVSNTFDTLYSCFVVQHLSREHGKALIRESLRVLKPGGNVLFEFFGDPAFYNGGEDVMSPNDERGPMFNNAFVMHELEGIISECGGKMNWIVEHPVDKTWGNHWVCFTKE